MLIKLVSTVDITGDRNSTSRQRQTHRDEDNTVQTKKQEQTGRDSEVRMWVVLVVDNRGNWYWRCVLIVGCQFLQALNTTNFIFSSSLYRFLAPWIIQGCQDAGAHSNSNPSIHQYFVLGCSTMLLWLLFFRKTIHLTPSKLRTLYNLFLNSDTWKIAAQAISSCEASLVVLWLPSKPKY